ncbi:urease accessory protein UreD [Streptomyces sp. NBC_01387]|uniref:urease accessory protein UreD n=1 Tax=unclassified Streptomyces TaxID=2593676 RepID=UPI0020250ECF|nr:MULTISPECIES: urease accessory protein UreD [unclassified Streptomyces]MCX4551468.1 urease accessory protein UreD [Streptomyces sp. NBC_01500]WSC22856.1 urease accessory protein UreD [Streptomyces sp. NBC_01766]WSV56767.1 urease accessory protein UreD [Streptomyces sp. NBC_01014]
MALVTQEPETSGGTRPGSATGRQVPRLSAAHHTPRRIPAEVARYASVPDTLPAGSAGRIGLLELGFERLQGRTELVHRYEESPLQIMHPLYVDPLRPKMAFTSMTSVGGGMVQADRYRIDVCCGAETEAHLTTQAATEVHRMEHDYATRLVNLRAGPDAYLEYLPDPLIPFRGARLYQRTVITADPTATVVIGETVTPGRPALGEHHVYDVLGLDLEVRRPDGRLLALDTMRFCPDLHGVNGPGVLSGHACVGSLFVVSGRCAATVVADALHTALDGRGVLHGVSVLPHDCGAWVRILGDDAPAVAAARHAAWDAARRLLTGSPAPDLRHS